MRPTARPAWKLRRRWHERLRVPSTGTSCREASCTSGVATFAADCAGTGVCAALATAACAPYTCGNTACRSSCSVDVDCANGNYCSSGQCVPLLVAGGPCTTENECGSGHCVDGVCCDTACTGQCEACDVATLSGTCSPVTGPPHGRTPCAADGACAGSCDGVVTANCIYNAGTECREASCTAGEATLAASCTAAGACPSVQLQDCGLFVCGATACIGDCTLDAIVRAAITARCVCARP